MKHSYLLLLTILTFSLSSLNAQTAKKLSIQGFLKDGNGQAVENGSYEITFKLYDVSSGGTPLWTEVNNDVKVFGGIYTVQLGAIEDITGLAWDVPYHLGVTVSGTELSPRTELTYAPYALAVDKAQIVECSGAVGDIKYSALNPTQFAQVNGTCWVPMDGRSISGSALASITGWTTIADASGTFLRAQEFSGGANNDPDRTSTTDILTLQNDGYASHLHSVNINTNSTGNHSHTVTDRYWNVTSPVQQEGSSSRSDPLPSTATNLTRTTSQAGNHAHNVSGNTGNSGVNETRPTNLNAWTYIRIN